MCLSIMLKMAFYIQFRGQLRRTRPELIKFLENEVASSACAAGGVLEAGRKVLVASFDEGRPCFWLDIVIFLENAGRALEKAIPELYGYALVLGRDIGETSVLELCHSTYGKNGRKITGIWCSNEILEKLKFYVVFNRQAGNKKGGEKYRELKEFRSFENYKKRYPYREKIKRALAAEDNKNALLLGPGLADIKNGIRHYCSGLPGNVPPLLVRFGAGGRGLECFTDAWTQEIRSFVTGAPGFSQGEAWAEIQRLDAAQSLLFRERLREYYSPFMVEQGRIFIRSLLSVYTAAARARKTIGVLILENITAADDSVSVFIEVYSSSRSDSSKEDKKGLIVLGLDSVQEGHLKRWEGIFDRILKFAPEDPVSHGAIRGIVQNIMPDDLLEMSYCLSLFGHYFPAYLFPQLFEEGGLNLGTYLRAQQMLSALGVSVQEDVKSPFPDFESIAETNLGDRAKIVRFVVRSRLLSWVLSGRLNPCFNLLKILSGLGERADDALVLKAIRSDVANGTWQGIEKAINDGCFVSIVGAVNAPLLSYIYKTHKALVWGETEEIRMAFQETPNQTAMAEGELCYGGCLAHSETNLAAFNIGCRNIDAASEAVRKAMLINRDLGEGTMPAAYRFFSLVNLCRQRLDDALEYISFALEQAGRTMQHEEIFLSCYYGSSINLLYGNLSKAVRLAFQAEETAFGIGQVKWGMRARFLRGRLFFEIGRYGEALDIFESIIPDPAWNADYRGCNAEIGRTVAAWVYRTRNLLGRFAPMQEKDVFAGSDFRIFEIEAAYFSSDYKRAVDLAGEFLSSQGENSGESFLFTEQPDWRSGFSQCECFFRPEKLPGVGLASVYRVMSQCALHPSPETVAEILAWMQRFIRDELLPDTDPNDAVYFYAWYCMLRDSKDLLNTGSKGMRTSQVDLKTVVSMGLKRLQKRAGRIDDNETKQAFLNLSRWNSALHSAGKENKLI